MPKEQINYARTQSDGVGFASPEVETSIHWSGGSAPYAQIGFEFNVKMMRKYLDDLAKDSPDDSRAHFYTDMLTREDLQRTIRAAKRARNAVFGADE